MSWKVKSIKYEVTKEGYAAYSFLIQDSTNPELPEQWAFQIRFSGLE